MSEILSEPVEHTRRIPATWPGLLALAGAALEISDSPSPKHVRPLCSEITSLTKLELDQNRYYAYGLLFCRFAKNLRDSLQDPDSLVAIAESGAEYIRDSMSTYMGNERDSFRLSSASRALSHTFDKSRADCPADFRLLAGSLEIHSILRQKYGATTQPPAWLNKTMLGTMSDAGIREDRFFGLLKRDMFLGMSNIKLIGEKLAGRQALSRIDQEERTKIFATLRQESTLKLLRGLGSIPLSVFEGGLGDKVMDECVYPSEYVIKQIDWPATKPQIEQKLARVSLSNNEFQERTERLVCPAVTVPEYFSMMHQLGVSILEAVYAPPKS